MQIDLPECCSYAPDQEKGPYIYFVKGDKRVILPGEYPLDQSNSDFWKKYFDCLDFWKKYFDCLNGDPVDYVECDTLSDLIWRYRASDEFANLRSDTSRKKYNLYLRLMEEKIGECHLQQIKKTDLIKLRDSMKDKPATANYLLTVAAVVFEKGVNLGWIDDNPVIGISKIPAWSQP
jgi:hypothetical protein